MKNISLKKILEQGTNQQHPITLASVYFSKVLMENYNEDFQGAKIWQMAPLQFERISKCLYEDVYQYMQIAASLIRFFYRKCLPLDSGDRQTDELL